MARDEIIVMAHNIEKNNNGLSWMPNPFLGKLDNKIPWNDGVEFTMHKVCLPLSIYYFSIQVENDDSAAKQKEKEDEEEQRREEEEVVSFFCAGYKPSLKEK